jgi:hypothetical protein
MDVFDFVNQAGKLDPYRPRSLFGSSSKQEIGTVAGYSHKETKG